MRSSVIVFIFVAIVAGGRPCLALSIPSAPHEFCTTASMGNEQRRWPDPTTTCNRPPLLLSLPPVDVDNDSVPDWPLRCRDGAASCRMTSKRWRNSVRSWASG